MPKKKEMNLKQKMLYKWLGTNILFVAFFLSFPQHATGVAFAYTAVMFGLTWWFIAATK